MAAITEKRDGGHILVQQLLIQGTDTVFCVPGESFLPVINAFYDFEKQINLVVCRQEGGAAYMADAYGKLKCQPGVVFVTRGPGASNAAIGVHTAYQDSTPLILFIGQVGSQFADREAFQEVDFRRMFGEMTKWVAQIERVDRIPEYVSKAFQIATSGRPGPVVISLPEDILSKTSDVPDGFKYKKVKASPSKEELENFQSLLNDSNKPLMLIGGSDWSSQAKSNIRSFVEKYKLPVACSFRRQDLIDNKNNCYAGDVGIGINPALKSHIERSDLIIVLGPRLGEMTTGGYTLFSDKRGEKKLVHIHQGAEELGVLFCSDLMINSGMEAFTASLMDVENIRPRKTWENWTKKLHSEYLRTLVVDVENNGFVDLSLFLSVLKNKIPQNSIITNGAGNYTGWVQRYWQYSDCGTQLAPTSGAMGYGVPSAVTAGLVYPSRTVVSFSGDGCFLMNGQELATAVQYGLKILFVVINNQMYGTIRLHQEKTYPSRVYGTDLVNPDFAMLAKSYGLHGDMIHKNEDIEAALDRGIAAKGSALIEIRVDPNKLTNRLSLPL